MATEPHAVRWAQREILGRYEMQYSKWHWTLDASLTLCNRPIQLIADGPALLPETHDNPAVTNAAFSVSRSAGVGASMVITAEIRGAAGGR